jgi:hypothetical protein
LAGPGVFGIPQRWILVAATSASFVLCNMDKARAPRAAHTRARSAAATLALLYPTPPCPADACAARRPAPAPQTGEHVRGADPHGAGVRLERRGEGARQVRHAASVPRRSAPKPHAAAPSLRSPLSLSPMPPSRGLRGAPARSRPRACGRVACTAALHARACSPVLAPSP